MTVIVQRCTWFGNRTAFEEIVSDDEKMEDLVRITGTGKDVSKRFVSSLEKCKHPYLVRVFVSLVKDNVVAGCEEVGTFFPAQPEKNLSTSKFQMIVGSVSESLEELLKRFINEMK
jgi:hypothetical protein